MKNEIIINEEGELIANKTVIAILNKKEEIETQFKQLEEIKKAIKSAMKNNNVRRAIISNTESTYQLTYTPEGIRTTVDVEKLKRHGIYEEYSKEVSSGDRLTITKKERQLINDEENQ